MFSCVDDYKDHNKLLPLRNSKATGKVNSESLTDNKALERTHIAPNTVHFLNYN